MIVNHPISTLVEELLVEDPAERSKRDPIYRAAFIAAVEEGLADFERGDYITHEKLKKEFYSWFTK
jgi:predicted transcriptional regulator